MVQVQRCLYWTVLAAVAAAAQGKRFYPDDPIEREPAPLPVGEVQPRPVNAFYDFLLQSARPDPRPAKPARAVNTLGEVPDSAWFTNRHARRRMSLQELRRGPGDGQKPVAPFLVVGAKIDGITPGFRMTDARGRLFFVKPDPADYPELATAADVIGSKFFHALGYNTPENYLVMMKRSDLTALQGAKATAILSSQRYLNQGALEDILDTIPRRPDGTMRMLASLALPGKVVGPFKYEGMRRDDPNDTVPHEDRRDLRGLHVLCAWLNHTDAKGQNSLDTVVQENGVRFLRHHLIDFGATLGSDSDMPKNARFGYAYVLPEGKEALLRIFTFGLHMPEWERARYPDLKAVGRLEYKIFDPEKWRSNYPNPAFLNRLPEDEYWAAKLVMAFRDEEIRAIVETGEYSDQRFTDYVTKALIERRNKIGRTYFEKILPLDAFEVTNGQLRFDDLAAKHGFRPVRNHVIAWSVYDSEHNTFNPISGRGAGLPAGAQATREGQFLAARLSAEGDARQSVTVYLRKEGVIWRAVGIDRSLVPVPEASQ